MSDTTSSLTAVGGALEADDDDAMDTEDELEGIPELTLDLEDEAFTTR